MIIRIASIVLISTSIFCMEVPVCSLAQKDDLPGILALYTRTDDKEETIFLPPQAREEALRKGIELQRLCVTKINDQITAVALRKANHV
jgi:hypothetical protein